LTKPEGCDVTTTQPTVFVVDDDSDMRESLNDLISSVRLPVKDYPSATEFLDDYDPSTPGCVLLDVRMPGMSGLELQDKLRQQRMDIPIIIITGHGDVPMALRAMKNGAVDFIEKPFRPQVLLDRIREAIDKDAIARKARARRSEIAVRFARLTPRERQVVDLLVSGCSSKQIATQLGVTSQAIDAHRARATKKLEVNNLAELIRLALTHADR
jgi:FixJ family two-component response regulator